MKAIFIFFLEAKGSFNVCAASEAQTALGGRRAWRGAELCIPARGHRLSLRGGQAASSCVRLRDLGSPPKLTSACLGSFPISAQSSPIPCFSMFLRWRRSTFMPMGCHPALVLAARRSRLLEEITDTLSNKVVLYGAS